MGYVIPSVLVYQLLKNSGGVLNSSPDLNACIIGPCYNLLDYVPGSLSSMVATAALSTASTTGSIVANSNQLTVGAIGAFSVDDSILIAGAGDNGATLSAKITGIAGNLFTLDSEAVTTVVGAKVSKQGKLVNNAINNNYFMAGQSVGQALDEASVKVWLNNARIQTWSGLVGRTGAVSDQSYSTTLTVTTPTSNVNAATSTLKVEAGDEILLSYTSGSAKTFSSIVTSMTTSSGMNGNLTTVTLADSIPSDVPVSGSTLKVLKSYDDVPLAAVYDAVTNWEVTDVPTGSVQIKPNPNTVYGTLVSSDIHISYRALRTDLIGAVQSIEGVSDLEGKLGTISDENPLALATQIALANTVTSVKVVGIPSNDLEGYQAALDLIEDEKVYYITPLTQDVAILSAIKSHVEQLSTPEQAGWRVCIGNTVIPKSKTVGNANLVAPNETAGNVITLINGNYVLRSDSATFLSDGVIAGDTVSVVTGGVVTASYKITQVINNQQAVIDATAGAASVAFFIDRKLTKDQQATAVAAQSATWNSKRMWHVQPDSVGITVNGVLKYLPGYYLCAGLAGMGAGFAVQQGFTNVGIAGVSDLRNSNFYFTKSQMGIMASAGTCLFAQQSQGTQPYCRHELTTDVSVLEYRELQQVKNWDYLSYLIRDKLKMFIGSWNITDDTINIIRQTITAAFELEKTKKLPKIGAPLVSFNIVSIAQNEFNKDMLDVNIEIKMATPLNYVNIYLIV